jgi:predicted  nucleic acid-binding Zn-ribbon protein
MSYIPKKSPKQSNKTQTSLSPKKNSPNQSNKTQTSLSPKKNSPNQSNKTRKSLSPKKNSPNKSEELKNAAFDIFRQSTPKSLETLKLFSTNKTYKKQFSYIDELDIKLQTFNSNITKLENFISETYAKMNTLEHRLYELDDDTTSKNVKKEKKKIKSEIEDINNKIKKANNEINKYDLMIEDIEFIRRIWSSKNIDEMTKKTYTEDYNNFIKVNQSKIDEIEKQIEINKKQKDNNKYEFVFKKNMDEWNILNAERAQFKNNILTKI